MSPAARTEEPKVELRQPVYDPRMRRLLGGLFLASQPSVTGCAAVDGRFECESEVQKAISGRGQCWKEIAGARKQSDERSEAQRRGSDVQKGF
jgi:hypothetical protein